MKLSVIVASYECPAQLESCLRSLCAQPAASQIIVSDCSADDPAREFAGRFPRVAFRHFGRPMSLPALRWAVLDEAGGDIVAAVEARCLPAPDWAAKIVAGHERFPAAGVVGGTVGSPEGLGGWRRALYLCEFAASAPPVNAARASAVSPANLSYRRRVLDRYRDVLKTGAWETILHERMERGGLDLAQTDAAVVYHHDGMTFPEILRQRFFYGQGYAAERVRFGFGPAVRLYAAVCPLLPLVLTLRTARLAAVKRLQGSWVSLPWIVLLNAVWSAGEFVGYLLGEASEPAIF